jgi:hypothetical protein
MAEVESPTTYDRVCPGRAVTSGGYAEARNRLMLLGCSGHEPYLAILAPTVEHAIGTGQRTFADPFFGVFLCPVVPRQTDPMATVLLMSGAVKITVQQNHAAMMVVEFLRLPHGLDGRLFTVHR